MKKLATLTAIIAVIAGLAIPNSTTASSCSGVWVDVYEGNPMPMHQTCVYHWLWTDCLCGDTRPIVVE